MAAHRGPNADMVDYWNGPNGAHWVRDEARFDAMLAPFVAPILDAAGLGPGDRVVDIGCGNGALSRAAASRAARVTGVDVSTPMIARARERAAAERLDHVEFVVADAQEHPLPEADVVVSRFGVMFFADPVAAFANVRRSLRSGGRLVFVCWQDLSANDWVAVPARALVPIVGPPRPAPPGTPGPFSLADPERVAAVLHEAGFDDLRIDDLRLPILVGGGLDVDESVGFFAQGGTGKGLLAEADAEVAARGLEAVREALAPHLTPDGVRLGAAVWLVRAGV